MYFTLEIDKYYILHERNNIALHKSAGTNASSHYWIG
jgi:hypothetical protein